MAKAVLPLGVESRERADAGDLMFPPRASVALDDARRIIERRSASVEWITQPNAPDIARRVDEILTDFPELEFECPRDVLARAIVTQAPKSTRALGLAHIVAPEDDGIFEMLLVALAGTGNWQALNTKLDCYRPGQNIDKLIARIALRMPAIAHDQAGLATLARLGERLSARQSLAALRLSEALSAAVGNIFAAGADATEISGSITQSRRLIQRYRTLRSAEAMRLSRSSVHDTERLQRLAALIGTRLPLPAPALQMSDRKGSSGVVSWLTLVQEVEGRVEIPASKFQSSIALLTKGAFKARAHISGTPFIFGPYVMLPKGVFTVRFLGEADKALRFELAATCDCGVRKLAVAVASGSSYFEAASVLGELRVYVPNDSSPLEFTITPLDSYGTISFHGVMIDYGKGGEC